MAQKLQNNEAATLRCAMNASFYVPSITYSWQATAQSRV